MDVDIVRVHPGLDYTPIIEAWSGGNRIKKTYVDGGAEINVMTEATMERLGLKVHKPSRARIKMANSSRMGSLGIIRRFRVSVLGVEAEIDVHVMLAEPDAYPLILGRPWLIATNTSQHWGAGTLVIHPKGSRKIKFDIKAGKPLEMDYESTADEEESSEVLEDFDEDDDLDDAGGLMGVQPELFGISLAPKAG